MFEGLADQAASSEGANTAQSDSSQTQPTQHDHQSETEHQAKTPTEQQLIDLAKVPKFLAEGKEMTWEELNKERMRHSDYTKKTQALAEERKFYDNLNADLKAVKSNPSLISEFKKMYPEKFHAYLDYVTEKAQEAKQAQSLPPEIQEKLSRIDQHEQMLQSFQQEKHQAEAAKINNTLESYEQKFLKKYPNAEIGSVYHAIETHVKKMREENPEYGIKDLNEKVVEGFYKSTNDYFNKRFSEWQQNQLKSIRDGNKMGSDIPPGGGVPSGAPQKMRLKDVADSIINGSDFNQ